MAEEIRGGNVSSWAIFNCYTSKKPLVVFLGRTLCFDLGTPINYRSSARGQSLD